MFHRKDRYARRKHKAVLQVTLGVNGERERERMREREDEEGG